MVREWLDCTNLHHLAKEVTLTKPYDFGEKNITKDGIQVIRISEGCPNQCPYCAEPSKIKWFGVPEITSNKVRLVDMNLLCKQQALETIKEFGEKLVNDKVIYYELTCGIDFRFFNYEFAKALKNSRFKRIRIAWDFGFEHQYKVSDAIKLLEKVGYRPNDIMVFMIANWRVSYEVCKEKMDLCKVWNVKIGDCYYDNQTFPNVKPIFWDTLHLVDFRRRIRKHNQEVNFKIDPEFKQRSLPPLPKVSGIREEFL